MHDWVVVASRIRNCGRKKKPKLTSHFLMQMLISNRSTPNALF